jgi:RNA polymerase sigma-70 factor (ECF subfamily)
VEPIDDTADPARRIEGTERQAELADALDRLPDTQRDVLVMRFLLGRSVADVARALGRSDGAVKQLQARGLANLRRELEP